MNTPDHTSAKAEDQEALGSPFESRGTLRVYLRMAVILAWTLSLFAVALAAWPLRLISVRLGHLARRLVQRIWSRGVARIMGLRVACHGAPPKHPFYLVSNHVSYLDVLTIVSQRSCTFVAMAEVARWPLIGIVATVVGTIFVNRKLLRDTVRVNQAIGTTLDQGEGIVIFAEGTTSAGNGTLPFKPALFEAAASRGMAVHCVAIHYEAPEGWPPATQSICWVDETPFPRHAFDLLRLPYIKATVIFGEAPIEAADRKGLAQGAQAAVAKALPPMK